MTNDNTPDDNGHRPLTPMEKVAIVGVAAPLVQQAAEAAATVFGREHDGPPTETRGA